MSVFVSPARRRLEEGPSLDYPFGGKLSRNVLEQFHGLQKTIKVLFLGCQDLRNVLETVGSKSNNGAIQHLSIHLNHPSPLSFARNVLILQVISAPSFDVDNKEDISYLWDLWYNLQWPKSTSTRFEKDVKTLIETGLESHNEQHFNLSKDQQSDLLDLFGLWSYAIKMKLHQPSQIDVIMNSRLEFIKRGGREELDDPVEKESSTAEVLKRLAVWRNSLMESDGFTKSLKKKLYKEVLSYFNTGTCSSLLTAENDLTAINPTLFEPKTFNWRVDFSSCPFDTYFPLDFKKLDTSLEEGIITRYCQEKLKHLVAEYRRKKDDMDFNFYMTDDLKASLPNCEKKFDVIDCSTLADEVGLANLIVTASQKLELHHHALLVTESFQWGTVASTISEYVEDSLCAPLSMLPTIYGLRVANQVELGRTHFIEKDYPAGFPPITLCWRQVPRYENAFISNSLALKSFISNLKKKCFFNEDDRELNTKENCGAKRYTPLTFSSIVTNLTQVMKKEGSQQFKFKPDIASQFALAHKTLEDWADGRAINLIVASQIDAQVAEPSFLQNQSVSNSSGLRLVLIPCDLYAEYKKRQAQIKKKKNFKISWSVEIPRAHYIDNFDLVYKKIDEASFSNLQVSFLLSKNHGLEKTHCAIVVDLKCGKTLMSLGDIKDMQQEPYTIPHPSSKHLRPTSNNGPQSQMLKVLECKESETGYELEVSVLAKGVTKGVTVLPDMVLPCLSTHNMVLSVIPQGDGMKPLALCFPFPVLESSINAWRSPSKTSIQFVAEKALYEPWPSDFKEQTKLNVEELAPFPSTRSSDQSCMISHHTNEGQYDKETFRKFQNAFKINKRKPSSMTPMEDVRSCIIAILPFAQNGCQYFTVLDNNIFNNQIWHFYVHLPIVTSPLGAPMLLMTAFDLKLFHDKSERGKLDGDQVEKDYKRTFGVGKKLSVRFPLTTDEGPSILRHVLRLNSTKMQPTKWQRENLPSGDFSPFLPTFLSPLYQDNQHPWDATEFTVRKDGLHSLLMDPSCGMDFSKAMGRCTGCDQRTMKHELKRCSNCKGTAYYCSVECQRKDWKNHKSQCVQAKN